ncbi:MAG: NAD-dependent epimerase/dehydratase family protein [Saprospiraceae bacterium]|nr:NAD-dependent epimerase/dehydratase family protein [Saprospiraceae bacterium]MCF8252383.1 NAD-dependent epimerase/dehydratase family protein [Saprospiraceae bacterium]MCF8282253.1 NAD-dependent epimerase/dehydratase family protein [Bacteroidales bacterium]MCF8313993.1 NAD-dependent epimerase/dehydratase family protein [Saprospiraceae bacterium]MCF8442713.1 NAD-dependent epimerase/dehydratase family protein [Saprospiraceae bacterium]
MKILVTGADGFVGSNLVRELLKRNHEITALVQRGVNPVTLEGLPIKFCDGDLLDPASLRAAMQGCDALVHSAAHLGVWPYHSDIQRKVNVDGTRNVMELALELGLKRIVFVGTANSYGYGSRQNPGDETRPYNSAHYGLGYMDTKREAQDLVLKMVKEQGLPAVVVNPTFMFGPFALKTGATLMIDNILHGKLAGYTPGGRNYVAVKDVVVGIANALERGRIGECYLLANQNMNYQEIFNLIAEVLGVKPPKMAVPGFVVLLFGRVATALARLQGKAPKISYRMCRISLDENFYSPEKARRELDLPQTPIKIAIQETYDWLKENGKL